MAQIVVATAQPSLPAADRLLLRPRRDQDASVVRRAFNCPNIQQWHVRSMDELSEACSWSASCNAMWQRETGASWAVVTSDDDRPVGQVGLRKVSLFEAQAAISYWTVPEARGRGMAVAATTAVAEWATMTYPYQWKLREEWETAARAAGEAQGKLIGEAEGWAKGEAKGEARAKPMRC